MRKNGKEKEGEGEINLSSPGSLLQMDTTAKFKPKSGTWNSMSISYIGLQELGTWLFPLPTKICYLEARFGCGVVWHK